MTGNYLSTKAWECMRYANLSLCSGDSMTLDLFTHAITRGAEEAMRELTVWLAAFGITIGWVGVVAVAATVHANYREKRT